MQARGCTEAYLLTIAEVAGEVVAVPAMVPQRAVLTDDCTGAVLALVPPPAVLTDACPGASPASFPLSLVLAECTSATCLAVVTLLAVRTLWHPKGWLCVCLPCVVWVDERTDGERSPTGPPLRVLLFPGP